MPNGVLGSGIGNFGYAMSNSGNYVTGIGLYPWNPANGFNQGMGYYYNGSTVSPLASTVLSGWANNYEWPGVPVWNPNQPNGVNNSGIVVGQYNNSAFYSLQGGAPVTIPGFPDGVGPMAYSINDNGLIVGDWDTQNNGGYAGFMYNLNTNTLTQLPGFAAFSVNDKGEMAGCGGGGIDTGPAGRNGNPASYGYGEWRDAGGNLYTIPTMMQATAIDSSGTYICGQGSDASASPTLYNTVTGTTVQVAPGTGSWICSALGVNSSGVVVGSMSPVIAPNPLSPQWFTNAFVYAGGTSEYIGNLTLGGAPSGIVWTAATAINDAGQMLVQGALTGAPYGSPVSATCILTPALPGDANLDGTVDINDLTIVLAHYGQTGMTWSAGRVHRRRHGGHQRPHDRAGQLQQERRGVGRHGRRARAVVSCSAGHRRSRMAGLRRAETQAKIGMMIWRCEAIKCRIPMYPAHSVCRFCPAAHGVCRIQLP